MGKPFSQELELLRETFIWSTTQQIDIIETLKEDDSPVLIIGSGGSLSACFVAVNLLQSRGIIAKAITPLEIQYHKQLLKKSRLVFISAGGRNTDIVFAYKTAIECDPSALLTICMRENAPLSKLSGKYSTSKAVEYKIPAGKDGFLATNSLIAYFTIFIRALSDDNYRANDLDFSSSDDIITFSNNTTNETTICVLYAGWGQPAAIDIESKFTEAALGNVHIADYRNFAHGRHHWFAKRPDSAIVALVTPDEELLAVKTLQMLPESIPKLILRAKTSTPYASLDLLIKSFRLVEAIGAERAIDPGRPGVPDFGRKIYNLKFTSLIKSSHSEKDVKSDNVLPLLRKAKAGNLASLNATEFRYWSNAYKAFIKSLTKAKFGAIIFDYDGTLCRPQDRFKHLSSEVKSKLNDILRNGFVIGVVTGRGQSVRKELQLAIEKKYWKNILVGYYNGADIGVLGDNKLPNKGSDFDSDLASIHEQIKETDFPFEVKAELRPKQLTIEINDNMQWKRIRPLLLQIVMRYSSSNVQVLESSHSMDVIKRPDVSKINIVTPCVQMAKELGLGGAYLCIGDRGQWPGNDFELLATPHSLSVDEVSSEKDRCWNIAPAGAKGVDATLLYLDQLKFSTNHFNFVQ